MTIHSRESRVDARVTSGLLARSVLASLGTNERGSETDAIGNLVRLLEMYRHEAFSSPSYQGILERKSLDSIRHFPASHAHSMGLVEAALRKAHTRAFDLRSREEVVDILEGTLRAFSEGQNIDVANLERTKTFLSYFLEALR